MRSHTNVNLKPQAFDSNDRAYLSEKKLMLEIEVLKKKNEYLFSELENILEAIDEWGYVDLCIGNRKQRLVAKEQEGNDRGGGMTEQLSDLINRHVRCRLASSSSL